MTALPLDHPIRTTELGTRTRGARATAAATRPRRAGMVSEAVVARYIRDLSARDRRDRGAARGSHVTSR